jgi:predicted PurR-regulated permease PerM
MARTVSFIVLVLVTSVLLVLFYQVVSVFLLPLFLAVVTVLLLRPLQKRIAVWCGNRRYAAASLMTIGVLLAVLIPILAVFAIAGYEAAEMVSAFRGESMRGQLDRARTSMGLDYPFVDEMRFIEASLDELRIDAARGAHASGDRNAIQHILAEFERMQTAIQASVSQHSTVISERLTDSLQHALTQEPGTLDYRKAIERCSRVFRDYKSRLLGGTWRAPLKEMAHPTPEELQRMTSQLFSLTTGNIASIGGAATLVVARATFSLLIFVMALFFWFADGPEIIQALMVLSPLEDQYEQELMTEFEVLVRAVVAGSIASAAAQAVLAGLGFWFAGVNSVFLLMALTLVFAMVPFVGASLVWLPVCAWLAFVEQRLAAGIGLALYGLIVISTIDNVLRPWIIVEKASLHPLAGLVGVLGGIQALGPVGVFVGPIVVAFLQTILTLLHREITEKSAESRDVTEFVTVPESTSFA